MGMIKDKAQELAFKAIGGYLGLEKFPIYPVQEHLLRKIADKKLLKLVVGLINKACKDESSDEEELSIGFTKIIECFCDSLVSDNRKVQGQHIDARYIDLEALIKNMEKVVQEMEDLGYG